MKKINLLILFVLVALLGCKKNGLYTTEQLGIEGRALTKLVIASTPAVAPTVLVYDNGERISGALLLPYGYPGGGFGINGSTNGDYLSLDPGSHKFEMYTTNAGTANLISKILEATQQLEGDKKVSVYVTDTGANVKSVKAPDDAATPDSGFTTIRFTHLIPNVPSVDFYKGTTLLKANVAYTTYTEFMNVAIGNDSFSIRIAGSAPGTAASALAYRVFSPSNRRIYSFLSRGYQGSTGNRVPTVSVIVNQ